MDVLFRAASLCVIGCILSLTIRRETPELSLLLSAAAGLAALACCGSLLRGAAEALRAIAEAGGVSETLLRPVLKCTAISLITEYSAGFCRDAGQSAAAAVMEFCGTLCALTAALPLIVSLFDAIAALV